MAVGGGGQITADILSHLKEKFECKPLDYDSKDIDFDTLIVFGFTFLNIHMLEFYKQKGVKVILYPIYDRMKSRLKMKLFKFLIKAPIMNIYSFRHDLLNSVDMVLVANDSEKQDMIEIYDCNPNIIVCQKYCLNKDVFTKKETVSEDLFYDKYKIRDFVFCSAVVISKRKNQIALIKALSNTGITLVLNNTHKIIDGLETEFNESIKTNKNVLCLESMEQDMLISCYKNAKVNISVSNAETAGLVNLEAGLMGCNLVASGLESHREYLGEYAIFVDQNNLEDIKKAVILAYNTPKNLETVNYIIKNYKWEGYIENLVNKISQIQKS